MGNSALDKDDLTPPSSPIPIPIPAPLPFMNEQLLQSLKDSLMFEALDPILLIDLLLCFVMGGEKHLVVRTLKRDEEVVKRIVGAMTMNVFGKHTQRVDLMPSYDPQEFLRDMFIYPAGRRRGGRKRANTATSFNPSLASSTSNIPPPLPSSFNPFTSHQPHHQHRLSTSNETSSSNHRQSYLEDGQTTTGTDSPLATTFPPPPHPSRYRQQPRASRAAAPSSIFPALRPGSHLYAPSTTSEVPSPFDDSHPAGGGAQKKRLPPAYLPQVLILTGVERAAHSVQMKIGEMLRTKRVVVSPREGESEDEDDDDEEVGGGKTPVGSWNLPRGFVVIWVKVVDQAGHGTDEKKQPEPEVGSWLYDLFTLTYDVPWLHPDIEDMLPPPQIVARITPDEIETLHTLYLQTHLSPTLKTYLSSLLSSLLHHPHLKSQITPRTRVDLRDLVAAIRVVLSPVGDHASPGGWFATPDDVRRVWTAGMKHRVSLRERARGEIMGSFNHWRTRVGAGGELRGGEGEEVEVRDGEEKLGGKGERLMVEGLLVELLRVV